MMIYLKQALLFSSSPLPFFLSISPTEQKVSEGLQAHGRQLLRNLVGGWKKGDGRRLKLAGGWKKEMAGEQQTSPRTAKSWLRRLTSPKWPAAAPHFKKKAGEDCSHQGTAGCRQGRADLAAGSEIRRLEVSEASSPSSSDNRRRRPSFLEQIRTPAAHPPPTDLRERGRRSFLHQQIARLPLQADRRRRLASSAEIRWPAAREERMRRKKARLLVERRNRGCSRGEGREEEAAARDLLVLVRRRRKRESLYS